MRLFNKVAIVGTGLIGGSLAQAIKNKRLCSQVMGVSRHRKNLIWAKRHGIIDLACADIRGIKDADLVILATPVETIVKLAPQISKIVRKDCVVTDVGSTKVEIVKKLNKLFKHYVGSHPIAGSEKRGIRNSNPCLFAGSLCLLTPTKDTDPVSLRSIRKMWEALGAKVVLVSPQSHDEILSVVSHLPHIVSFALMNSVPQSYFKFSTPSLKELTRIAGSDIEVWKDIVFSNRKNILKTLVHFQKCLDQLKSALKYNDVVGLTRFLKESKSKRLSLR
jgi:prephenate dehydrogenase